MKQYGNYKKGDQKHGKSEANLNQRHKKEPQTSFNARGKRKQSYCFGYGFGRGAVDEWNGIITGNNSFFELGSVKNKLEIEKLKAENDLIHAKAEMVRAQKNNEEMFKDAIAAMKEYSGNGTTEDDIEDEY